MEMKTRWLKRVSAWVLCFCLLGGVLLSGIVLPGCASDCLHCQFFRPGFEGGYIKI